MVGVNALTPPWPQFCSTQSGSEWPVPRDGAAAVFVLFVVPTVDCWWPEPGHELDINTNIYLSRLTSCNVVML